MPVAERQAVAISHGITLIGMPPLFWVYTRIHNDGGQLLLLVLLAVLTLASLQLARTLPAAPKPPDRVGWWFAPG